MNEEEAKSIIGLESIRADNSIYNLGWYVAWDSAMPHSICLDGNFAADYLEALAWWMRNKAGK